MTSQNHVTNDPLSSQTDDSEAHSHLKRNPCFLRNDTYGTASSYQFRKCPKQVDRVRSLSDEMFLKRIARAGMRLIPVCKKPPAPRAFPESCVPHGRSIEADRHDAIRLCGHSRTLPKCSAIRLLEQPGAERGRRESMANLVIKCHSKCNQRHNVPP